MIAEACDVFVNSCLENGGYAAWVPRTGARSEGVPRQPLLFGDVATPGRGPGPEAVTSLVELTPEGVGYYFRMSFCGPFPATVFLIHRGFAMLKKSLFLLGAFALVPMAQAEGIGLGLHAGLMGPGIDGY